MPEMLRPIIRTADAQRPWRGEARKREETHIGAAVRRPNAEHPRTRASLGDLQAMQIRHHLRQDYPTPGCRSVVDLQQRILRHFIDVCIDVTPCPHDKKPALRNRVFMEGGASDADISTARAGVHCRTTPSLDPDPRARS